MRKLLLPFLLILTLQLSAQYPITGITITLPSNPDAETGKWASGSSLLTISASTRQIGKNGRVEGHIQESSLLVTIKKNGTVVCGTYTKSSAPMSNFNTPNKVWSGPAALALLGQECTLTPGDYELSVQFFGEGAVPGLVPFSEEKIKPFSIREERLETYRPPQVLAPANQVLLSDANALRPITFRWTPVMPRPEDAVTYRLQIWQIPEKQPVTQVVRTTQPLISKDINNLTQAVVTELTKSEYKTSSVFAWQVQALNRDGKPIGGNNGMSELFSFSLAANELREYKLQDVLVSSYASRIQLIAPEKGAVIPAGESMVFAWSTSIPADSGNYKIKVVEVSGDQSPEQAYRTNKPIFEKDSGTWIRGNKPIFEKDSTVYLAGGNKPIFEKDTINWIIGNKPIFEKDSMLYIGGNKPIFEKDSLNWMVAKFVEGRQYAWVIEVLDKEGKAIGTSEVSVFKKGSTGDTGGNAKTDDGSKTGDAKKDDDTKTDDDDKTGGNGGVTKSMPVDTDNDGDPVTDSGSAAVGDTIRAGFNGEFLILVTQVTQASDGRLTGKGIVDVDWLSTNIAVEFDKIRIDSVKRLTAGGIKTQRTAGVNYPEAWLLANLTADLGSQLPVDGVVNWTNQTIDNVVSWVNNNNFSLPDIKYKANITAPVIPPNSLKMPFGVKFDDPDDKLMVTEIVFKADESKVNFITQKKFTKGPNDYKLGFAAKYIPIHPDRIEFSSGRGELAEDVDIPNLSANPKMIFGFINGADPNGNYIEWDSTGVKEYGIGISVKFSRDWLLPVATSVDTVKATLSGKASGLNNILLTGGLPHCEIVGTNGLKLAADSIALDLSETRNASFMYFPDNYIGDTSVQWEGVYMKTIKLGLPDTWKTGTNQNPPEIGVSNTLIDDFGVTLTAQATNILSFGLARVSDMVASLDTVEVSIVRGSLTDAKAKGRLVLPVSKDTLSNSLKYTAMFAQVNNSNSLQVVVVPDGPIQAEILKAQLTLSPTSYITSTVNGDAVSASINLNGTFKWDNPSFEVPATSNTSSGAAGDFTVRTSGIKGVSMEMGFQNLGFAYTNNWAAGTSSFAVSMGSWSFASPQKLLANFPVTIKKIYYKSLTKGTASQPGWKVLERGAVLIDIVANLTDDIGGSTTLRAGFALEARPDYKKIEPKFLGVNVESLEVHANTPAVKIDGSLQLYDHDPMYGDGFKADLTVRFNAISLEASALVQFGNTTYDPNNANANQYYRYWRVQAKAMFEPGIPFMAGLGFYGFGGGAYYNMDHTVHVDSGYVFRPKKGTIGFIAQATVATLPKFDTFNADLTLMAQFNTNTGGLTKLTFGGDLWLAASIPQRPDGKIKGSMFVDFDFSNKLFQTGGNLYINVPNVIKTKPSVWFHMKINGVTNKWFFMAGRPDSTNTVEILGVDLYSYFMFGNDIPVPNGFTPRFANKYQQVIGNSPGWNGSAGGVGDATKTGTGIATGVGIEFDRSGDLNLILGVVAKGTIKAGAELNLALMQQLGCVGINGWRAHGSIGLYAGANLAIYRKNKYLFDLLDAKAGVWITGQFPNTTFVAGQISTEIDVFIATIKYSKYFEYGTPCYGTAVADTFAAQEDEAADYKNKLIQAVTSPEKTGYLPGIYDVPVSSTINVRYALVPGQAFDVAENQGDGTIKNRTFRMATTTTLEVKNAAGAWTALILKSKANNMGEYQYFTSAVSSPLNIMTGQVSATVMATPMQANPVLTSNTGKQYLSMSASGFLAAPINSTVAPPPLPSYPNPPAPVANHLEKDKDYRFVVVATLQELNNTNNTWGTALTRQGQPVTETKTVVFRTGPREVMTGVSSINNNITK